MSTESKLESASDLMAQGRGPDVGPDVAVLREDASMLEALTARDEGHERAARSPRTRALYAAEWAHFSSWCRLVGRAPLPAEVEALRWYLSDLEAARGEDGARLYQPATLCRRLAAIGAIHRDAGALSATGDARVRAVLSWIIQARRHAPRRMRPLLLGDVRTILSGMD